MKRMKDRIEFEHRLQNIAILNALGKCFGKNYSYIDVFRDSNKNEVSEEEKKELKEYFDSW